MHPLLVRNVASKRMYPCWPQPQLICSHFHLACAARQRKCGRATEGRFSEIRDTLYSGMGTAEHFASAGWSLENWFCSDLPCRWYSVCQVRWTMLFRCYQCTLWETCSTGHAHQNPRDSYASVSEVNSDGTLECMPSHRTSKKSWAMKSLAVWHFGSHVLSCSPAVTLLLFLARLFKRVGLEEL